MLTQSVLCDSAPKPRPVIDRPDVLPDAVRLAVRDLRLWVVVDVKGSPVYVSADRRSALETCKHHRGRSQNLMGGAPGHTSYLVRMGVSDV